MAHLMHPSGKSLFLLVWGECIDPMSKFPKVQSCPGLSKDFDLALYCPVLLFIFQLLWVAPWMGLWEPCWGQLPGSAGLPMGVSMHPSPGPGSWYGGATCELVSPAQVSGLVGNYKELKVQHTLKRVEKHGMWRQVNGDGTKEWCGDITTLSTCIPAWGKTSLWIYTTCINLILYLNYSNSI